MTANERPRLDRRPRPERRRPIVLGFQSFENALHCLCIVRLNSVFVEALVPERLGMPLRRVAQEAAAFAGQVLLDFPLPRRKEFERVRSHGRIHEAGVRDDGRQPSRGQRLLDTGGRQRIDE